MRNEELGMNIKTNSNMAHSGGKWEIVPNSSWGVNDKKAFGDEPGYVICVERNSSLVAIASVQGYFKQPKREVEANAKLIASAPEMAAEVERLRKIIKDCALYLLDCDLGEEKFDNKKCWNILRG
jgi:hypothetical protein